MKQYNFYFSVLILLFASACAMQPAQQEQRFASYNPNIVYPDVRGQELGFQALGRDLSGGSVEIYSLGGPVYEEPSLPQRAMIDYFRPNPNIPVKDPSVVVYDYMAGPVLQRPTPVPQRQAATVFPPSNPRTLPSPFFEVEPVQEQPPLQAPVLTQPDISSAPVPAPEEPLSLMTAP